AMAPPKPANLTKLLTHVGKANGSTVRYSDEGALRGDVVGAAAAAFRCEERLAIVRVGFRKAHSKPHPAGLAKSGFATKSHTVSSRDCSFVRRLFCSPLKCHPQMGGVALWACNLGRNGENGRVGHVTGGRTRPGER